MNNVHFLFLVKFLNKMVNEERLNTSHISLCFALIICWDQQRHKVPFKVSRKLLMEYSRISSISTYHICMKDLINFQMVHYVPSYNWYKGTLVTLLNSKNC
jgi:hypothetical protein